MPITFEQIVEAALALGPQERERLARLLLDRTQAGFGGPGEVERAWMEEVMRRKARLDAGEDQAMPAEEVFARLRTRLRSA
jgi:putative addiction module component (TIGR02574 family)